MLMDSKIVKRSSAQFVSPTRNRKPCAACREQHKKCDISEGFPCLGCKSNAQKARACRPTTKPSKNITLAAIAEPGSDQSLFTATRTRSLVPELEPPMVPDQAYNPQLLLTEASAVENQEIQMPQAFQYQNLPIFEANGHWQSISNMHVNNAFPYENSFASSGTVPIRSAQPYPGFAGIFAESTMNTGMEYVQGHGSLFGTYNKQAALASGSQFGQYPFDFQNSSSFHF